MYGGTVKDRRKRVNCMCSGACPGVGATMLTCESNSGPEDEGRYPSDALIDSPTRPPSGFIFIINRETLFVVEIQPWVVSKVEKS